MAPVLRVCTALCFVVWIVLMAFSSGFVSFESRWLWLGLGVWGLLLFVSVVFSLLGPGMLGCASVPVCDLSGLGGFSLLVCIRRSCVTVAFGRRIRVRMYAICAVAGGGSYSALGPALPLRAANAYGKVPIARRWTPARPLPFVGGFCGGS